MAYAEHLIHLPDGGVQHRVLQLVIQVLDHLALVLGGALDVGLVNVLHASSD